MRVSRPLNNYQEVNNICQEIYRRLRQKRIELQMTQNELADKMGYKTTDTIRAIEQGQVNIPLDRLTQMMKILQITPNELFAALDRKPSTEIVIYNSLIGGIPIYYQTDSQRGTIHADWLPSGRYFGFRMPDDSMKPAVCAGDTVICSMGNSGMIPDERICVAAFHGKPAICRKVIQKGAILQLIPLNSAFHLIELTVEEAKNVYHLEIMGIAQIVMHRCKKGNF